MFSTDGQTIISGGDDGTLKFWHRDGRLRGAIQAHNGEEVYDIAVSPDGRTIASSGSDRTIELSPREYSLLEYLMRHPNQVLSRTQIAQHVWSFDFYGDYKVIDVYIGYLRRKLNREAPNALIHTVRGVGYRIGDDTP